MLHGNSLDFQGKIISLEKNQQSINRIRIDRNLRQKKGYSRKISQRVIPQAKIIDYKARKNRFEKITGNI